MSTIYPITTANHADTDQLNIVVIAVAVNKISVALETKCAVNACRRIQKFQTVLFIDFMVGAV